MNNALKRMMTVAMLCSFEAFAQAPAQTPTQAPAPPPPPPADELPLAVALEWAQAAITACKANGYNVTATYMNNEYGVKVALRADGTSPGTVDFGRRKAYTVIKSGMSSAEFGVSAGFPPGTPMPPPAPGAARGAPPGNPDQNLVVAPGGLQVKAHGKVVGAVSISGAPGGDKDVVCAEAGLAKIADKLK